MQFHNPDDPKGGPWHNAPPNYAPESMEYGTEDLQYGMGMKWKKIASMENEKNRLPFYSISCSGCLLAKATR